VRRRAESGFGPHTEKQMPRSLRISLLSILFLSVALLPSLAQGQKKPEPLTEVAIINLLQGGVSPERVRELARERGISFQVTPSVERDLRDGGATGPLIQTLREVAPPPAEPKPQAPPVLTIQCAPGSVQVFVDDELIARASPEGRLKISTLTTGQHRVRLALDGYRDYEQTVQLASSGETSVAATLQRAETPPPLSPHSPQLAVRSAAPKAYLGLMVQDLTPEAATALKVPDTYGALVQQVAPDGPAAAAGVEPRDVVRSFHEQAVKNNCDLISKVGAEEPGADVRLEVLRGGRPKSLRAKLTAPPADFTESVRIIAGALHGLTLMPLNDMSRKSQGLPAEATGVVVNGIEPNTPAVDAGLRSGDVIEEMNRTKVHSLDDFLSLAGKLHGDMVLLVQRQGKAIFVGLPTQQ
jgi:hypothetical protein